jgi:glycosyltransferase involved in cell wall biosynthesis
MNNWLLFIGGVFNESCMLKSKAISPAANRWEKGFIKAIKKRKYPVIILSHLPESIWPRGHIRPGDSTVFDSDFSSHLVQYWNVPFLRTISLKRNYIKVLKKVCNYYGKPLAVLSYNPVPHAVTTSLYAKKHYNIPWVDICADHYNPGDDWSRYSLSNNMAKGHVFLSYRAYKNAPFPIKIHLDGAINTLKFNLSRNIKNKFSKNKIILYTGMLNKWGGLDFLLSAFKKIEDKDIKLWICGHGTSPELDLNLANDTRISFFGLVSEKKLKKIYQKASIFINPRRSDVDGNMMNFPSKVLEYLSYGKPIVSTWTDGLSPDYRSVLKIINEETSDSLANSIQEVLSWSDAKVYQNSIKIKNFLLDKKTWDVQAQRLDYWLKNKIL